MPIKLDSYYIYSFSTFKTFGQYNGEDENVLHNDARKGVGSAKRSLAKSIENTSFQRTIQPTALDYYKNKDILVGIFEDELVRYIKVHYPDHLVTIAGNRQLVKGIVFMEVGKTHSGILKSIIDNGVIIENKEYRLYTAGSGQMRQNEITLVEKPILDGFKNLYACGLTDEIINANGGMNTGKYLAYSALPLSSSKPIDIDINKVIVVHDLKLGIKTC